MWLPKKFEFFFSSSAAINIQERSTDTATQHIKLWLRSAYHQIGRPGVCEVSPGLLGHYTM